MPRTILVKVSASETQIRSKLEILCRQLGRTEIDMDFVERQCRFIAELAAQARLELAATDSAVIAA